MPFTYNGCGTKYYGKREQGPDGSYITTEWVTFVYLPLIPLRSFRVCPTGKGTNAIIFNSQQFIAQKVPLNKRQVRNAYAVTASIIAAITAILVMASKREQSSSLYTPSLYTPLPAHAHLHN